MAEPANTSPPNERIVAVFPDEATAERAADRARRSGGRERRRQHIPTTTSGPSSVRCGRRRPSRGPDPSVAIYTPEMARHIPGPTAAGALLGALVALPDGASSSAVACR